MYCNLRTELTDSFLVFIIKRSLQKKKNDKCYCHLICLVICLCLSKMLFSIFNFSILININKAYIKSCKNKYKLQLHKHVKGNYKHNFKTYTHKTFSKGGVGLHIYVQHVES